MITGGPELSLNMGGRRDTSCRIPCDTQRAEDGRVLDNTYEYERRENLADSRRCLRTAEDGFLRQIWEGWLKGTTAGGLLNPPPEGLPPIPPHLPITECCVPAPIDPNADCPIEDLRTCVIDCGFGWDPRLSVHEEVINAHMCSVATCFMNSPVDGQDARNGAPPPYNGPNWCLDDIQKQIDETILDLKQLACVEEQCEGPINRNCPDRHPVLNEICRLEALKRARCDLFEIARDTRESLCAAARDYARDLMNAYNSSCWGVFDERNPCPSPDTSSEEELTAIRRCMEDFKSKRLLANRRHVRTRRDLITIRNELLDNRKRQYNAEVAACSCTGQGDTGGFPQLYPNWFEGLGVGYPIPDDWYSPLSPYIPGSVDRDGDGWPDDDPGLLIRNIQRFYRDLTPNWLPLLPDRRTPDLPT